MVYVPPTDGTELVMVAELAQFTAELPLSVESQRSFNPLFAYALVAVTVNMLPSIEYTISAFTTPAATAIIEARRKLYVFRPPPWIVSVMFCIAFSLLLGLMVFLVVWIL
jgi:hypothetical protein